MLDLLAVFLLQQGTSATDDPGFVGLARFFAGFFLIVTVVGGAWLFTYWISKNE